MPTIDDGWSSITERENNARRDFFTVMEWMRHRKYQPAKHEWRLIQQVFDEMFFRTSDTYALCGFVLGLPLKKVHQKSLLQRYKASFCFGALGYEIGLRAQLFEPATEFWQCATRLHTDLGDAARQIRVLEATPDPFELKKDPFRYISNHIDTSFRHFPGQLVFLYQAVSILFLRDTLCSLFSGSSFLHMRHGVGPSTTTAGGIGFPPLIGAAGAKKDDFKEPRMVTDVIKLRINTRFVTWTPITWRIISSPTTKVNSLSVSVPRLTANQDIVFWTLKSRALLDAHCEVGAKWWWKSHLQLYAMCQEQQKEKDGLAKGSSSDGGKGKDGGRGKK